MANAHAFTCFGMADKLIQSHYGTAGGPRHFALRPRLARLTLGDSVVSKNAVEEVLSWTLHPRRYGAAYIYRDGCFQLVEQPECAPRRPFALLKSLVLTFDAAAAVAPLSLLLSLVPDPDRAQPGWRASPRRKCG